MLNLSMSDLILVFLAEIAESKVKEKLLPNPDQPPPLNN